jgi:hypothetical protein
MPDLTPARKRTRGSAKAAGAAHEKTVGDYLAAALDDDRIERRVTNGAKDRGDIAGLRVHGQRLVVECKNRRDWQPGTWLREAEAERVNDGALAGLVVAKRHGIADPGQQVVLMTLADLVAIIRGVRTEEGS